MLDAMEVARGVAGRKQPVMIDMDLFTDVLKEHERQQAKHGPQNYPDGTGSDEMWALAERIKELVSAKDDLGLSSWAEVFGEEACEVLCERDPENLEKELVQVATVALAWATKLRTKKKLRTC